MKNKFLIYAVISAVLSSIPSFLPGYLKYAGCLVMIGSIIYFYKLYTNDLEDKTQLSIGLGAKFGLLVGAFILILSIITIMAKGGDLRAIAIEDAMSSGAGEAQLDAMEQMSDTMLYISMGIGFFINFVVATVSGVIAGAIFKHEEE